MSQLTSSIEKPASLSTRPETTLVLAFAAWLIFNSHLEAFYPLPWLAADGLLGNSMFFFISGFGIYSSLSSKHQGFVEYASRRAWRLYPSVFIALAFQTIFIIQLSDPGFTSILKTFVWPTGFTYVQIIVPLYIIIFLLFKLIPRFTLSSLLVFCLALYGLCYFKTYDSLTNGVNLQIGKLPSLISFSYFTLAFVVGAFMAKTKLAAIFRWRGMLLLVLVLLAYIALKYLMVVRGTGAAAYPLLHLLVLAACAISMQNLCDPELHRSIQRIIIVGYFVEKSGRMSLEIYVVHSVLLGITFFREVMFPVNIILFASFTFVLAFGLSRLVTYLRIHWDV